MNGTSSRKAVGTTRGSTAAGKAIEVRGPEEVRSPLATGRCTTWLSAPLGSYVVALVLVGASQSMRAPIKENVQASVANESNRPFALIIRNLAADGVREPDEVADVPTPAPTVGPGPVFAVAEADCPFGPSATHPDPYCPDWRPLIAQYGDWDQGEALAVLMCESSGDAHAVSYSNAIGGFQIQPNGSRDPATNVSQAHAKWLYGVSYGNRWGEWNRWGGCGWFS